MRQPKYKIGDKVWYARVQSVTKRVVCPECFGKKYLTVILGDDSKVTIDCAGCSSGFNKPSGFVEYHAWEPNISRAIINRMEITKEKIEYGIKQSYSVTEEKLFDNKQDAEKKAVILSEEYNKEQLAKIDRKDKNHRTWSWHVHYYKNQVRRAKRDLIHCVAKLDAAKTHNKNKEAKNGRL